MKKFQDMIRFQGVTEDAAQILCHEDIWSILKKSGNSTTLKSSKSGLITHIDALIVGKCCVELGAGRTGKSSEIDTTVGVELIKTVNDVIETGEEWIRVYHKEITIPESIKTNLESALHLSSSKDGIIHSNSIITKIMK